MQGDFEAFYLRHFKAIYRVCYAFMRNAADAEDCTEDTFVKAMSCDISFENERHERSWLTTTAMNICKDKLRFYLFWKSPFWCVTGIFRLNGIFPFRWLQLSGLLQNGIFDAVQRTVRVAFLLLYLFLYRKRAGSHRLFLLPVL